jgi:Ser/Thr protein kinase RdoA (MazF antagonist)
VDGTSSTHLIELRPNVVIKRYRAWSNNEPHREWRALTLLHEHAPGSAPAPISADLHTEPPAVVMSRLDGVSLEGDFTADVATAVARTVARVQEAIPSRALNDVPVRAGHPVEMLQQVRTWCAAVSRPVVDPLVVKAFESATAWIRQPALEDVLGRPMRPVFGTGDGNLANFLWDGTNVRLVDFEYSGRSDRPYELAELTEHISIRVADGHGMEHVLDCFDLSAAELGRLKTCRRLLALFWLLRILHNGRDTPTLARQAARLLALLDGPGLS